MKKYIRCSYNPLLLDELVNYYLSRYFDMNDDEIWDEIYDTYENAYLADDVIEALDHAINY